MRSTRIIFTSFDDALLKQLYPHVPNDQITAITGWGVHVLKHNSDRLGLRKTKECKRSNANATVWTDEMICFLKENFFKLTNRQLADRLGTRLTVLRNKAYELGLKRVEVDNWTPEMTAYLVANFKTMGDVEIMENLQRLYPRKKPWCRGNIYKKRKLLNLHRTPPKEPLSLKNIPCPAGALTPSWRTAARCTCRTAMWPASLPGATRN